MANNPRIFLDEGMWVNGIMNGENGNAVSKQYFVICHHANKFVIRMCANRDIAKIAKITPSGTDEGDIQRINYVGKATHAKIDAGLSPFVGRGWTLTDGQGNALKVRKGVNKGKPGKAFITDAWCPLCDDCGVSI